MINFSRAFESAWQRMVIILFRPLDPAKWFLIGFNAFLALLAEGGVSLNNPFPIGRQDQGYHYTYQNLPELLHGFKHLVIWGNSLLASSLLALYILIGIVFFVAWLAGNWVGCRGQFIFLDNIVRNRAALAVPWRRYARQGNVWFLVHLALVLVTTVFYAVAAGIFLSMNWVWINAERYPMGGEVTVIGIFLLIFFCLAIIHVVVMFLIHSFVVPLYFKQTMGIGEAFLAVARLLGSRPGSIAVYLLISLVLGLAGAIMTLLIFCAAFCVVCWLACIPFVGSMAISLIFCQLILPVLIFFRCFQLDCLAQFGPLYDVWIVDVPPGGQPLSFTPPPPPG